jgi:hypothetical protein
VYLDDAEPGGSRVLAQPGHLELIADRKNNQRVRGAMPFTGKFRKGDSEVKCRVRRLTRLRPGCQIGTSD